jgi:hypothetical protein
VFYRFLHLKVGKEFVMHGTKKKAGLLNTAYYNATEYFPALPAATLKLS